MAFLGTDYFCLQHITCSINMSKQMLYELLSYVLFEVVVNIKWHKMWEMPGCVAGREEMLKKFWQVWLACCWSYDRYWSAVSLTSNSTFYLWSFKIWSLPKSPSLSHALLQRLGHTSQLSAPHMCQLAPASRSSSCFSFGLSHYFLAHHGWLLIL